MKPPKIHDTSLFQLLGAFLFLSIVLNFDCTADHWFSWKLAQPSIDCWLLLIVLAIAACRSKRLLFWTTLPIYALFLVLRMIRIGDTVVPMYLNRPHNLYLDSGNIFSLYDLLKTSTHQEDVLLISASAMVIVLVYLTSSWYAWRLAARSLSDKPVRISLQVISGLLFSAALIGRWHPAETPAIVRLYEEALSTRQQLKNQQAVVTRMEKTAQDREASPDSLEGGLKAQMFSYSWSSHTVTSSSAGLNIERQ